MMHVFLDTNILFQDYFFEKFHNKRVLEYCEKGLIHLYMSDIVRLELRKQFLDELEEKNRDLKKVIKDAKRLRINKQIEELDIAEQLDKFDDFHRKLLSMDNYELLPYKNDFLPDVVDRAIYKKKPFTNEKMELKDALIWKTYSEFVESLSLETFVLLTENHTDFCDKKDHSKIHADLLKDTQRFKVVKNSFEFIKQYASVLESPQHKLAVFLERTQISDDYVNELVHEHFDDSLIKKIQDEVRTLTPNDVMEDQFWHDGYVSDGEIELLACEETEYEQLTNTILVYGKISACCEVEIFEYNASRDHGEDQYNSIEERTLTYEMDFSFNLSPDETVSDFEILGIELVDTN